jgi:outer membrane protein TolC
MMRIRFTIFSVSLILGCNIGWAQDLEFYIEQAKTNSPLIQDSKNQSEAAQLEAERLKAVYTKAQISLTGNYLLAPIVNRDNGGSKLELNPPSSVENYSGYDLASTNGGVYQGLLNISQPLFSGSLYETAAEQTVIGSEINQNTIQLTEHDLVKFVTDQYILCLQDYKQAAYLGNLIRFTGEQKNIVSKLVENGIAKQSDLSLITIEEKSQLTQLNEFKATYRRNLMDLRALCGIPDTTYQVLDDISLTLVEDVGMSRFAEKYRLDSLNLVASQKVFELKYKPMLSLFVNTGLNAVYAPTLADRIGLSAGVNFSMNISDGKQRKITQQRTAVLLRSTSRYKDFFYNQNRVRKNGILSELRSVTERLALIEEQLKEYEKLLDVYKRELNQGQLSVINYIAVLKNMTLTQRDFVLLQTNRERLINLYNYWNW